MECADLHAVVCRITNYRSRCTSLLGFAVRRPTGASAVTPEYLATGNEPAAWPPVDGFYARSVINRPERNRPCAESRPWSLTG